MKLQDVESGHVTPERGVIAQNAVDYSAKSVPAGGERVVMAHRAGGDGAKSDLGWRKERPELAQRATSVGAQSGR